MRDSGGHRREVVGRTYKESSEAKNTTKEGGKGGSDGMCGGKSDKDTCSFVAVGSYLCSMLQLGYIHLICSLVSI